MHSGNARRFELLRHAQIKIGRINAHEYIRAKLF